MENRFDTSNWTPEQFWAMDKYDPTEQEIIDLYDSMAEQHPEVIAAIAGENLNGYPTCLCNIMSKKELNRLAAMAGMKDPDYETNQIRVYNMAQRAIGTDLCDQWLPFNGMDMGEQGYENGSFSHTTGLKIIVDGIEINDPDDVVDHMERFVFPAMEKQIASFDKERYIRRIGRFEYNHQLAIGPEMLHTGYGHFWRPSVCGYMVYGYENYFMAYQIYPEIMEKAIKLDAKKARLMNEAAAEAYMRYHLPKLNRLDLDICDSRGPIVSLKSLEQMWFPQLEYALEPINMLSDVRMIWHCDGNVMPLVPGLIECGIRGFQGFQYETGVDYKTLGKMRGNDGEPLFFMAGASVTTTLPFGKPSDVRAEVDWLVENRGDAAIVLSCSSSMTPGVSSENIDAMIERFRYYRTHRK